MVTLFGTRRSRAFQCLWLMEEAGLSYRLEETNFATGDTRTPEFLAINPNGHVPVLIDGDLVLFESLAINLHLAQRYAPALWPDGADALSKTYQWTAWAMGEIEGPHDAANRSGTTLNLDALDQALVALRRAVAQHAYLLGDVFSVCDLNTASVLLRPQTKPFVEADQELQDWFSRCTARPALARVFRPEHAG